MWCAEQQPFTYYVKEDKDSLHLVYLQVWDGLYLVYMLVWTSLRMVCTGFLFYIIYRKITIGGLMERSAFGSDTGSNYRPQSASDSDELKIPPPRKRSGTSSTTKTSKSRKSDQES